MDVTSPEKVLVEVNRARDGERSLEAAVVRFAGVLRRLGMRISTSEVMEALAGTAHIDNLDRDQFELLLCATLVKKAEDMPLFEAAFRLFFSPPEHRRFMEGRYRRAREERERMISLAREELRFQGESLDIDERELETYIALTPSEQDRLKEFLERSSSGIKVDASFRPIIENIVKGHLSRRRREMMHGPKPYHDLRPTGDEVLDAVVDALVDGAGTGGSLLYRDLMDISGDELKRTLVLVERLTRQLAGRISRRYKRSARRKSVDIRRTVRANIQFGGVPIKLKYRRRSVQKPRIILICDVSGSMSKYAGFVLQFVYGLTSVADRIESFIFSEDLERITPHLWRRRSFEETVKRLLEASGQWGQGTDLRRALSRFRKEHQHLLTPNTFMIIVSDAKTLGAKEAASHLGAIRRRVREILWLNPVPRAEWDELPAVEQFCRSCRMFECFTLAHLEHVLRERVWA